MTGFSSLFAQEINLEGKILDSTQNPIPYTNLIATPLTESQDITFAITDVQGRHKLNLAVKCLLFARNKTAIVK